MAQIIINIPDDKVQELLAAISDNYGYETDIGTPDNPQANPESRAQFSKRQMIAWMKNQLKIKKDRESSIQNAEAVSQIELT